MVPGRRRRSWAAAVLAGVVFGGLLVAVPAGAQTASEFDLAAGNGDASGIWGNHTTIWVSNDGADDDRIYAYNRSDGSRDATKDIELGANGNQNPRGLWSDGRTMFVVDRDDRMVYAYKLHDDPRTTENDFGRPDPAGNIELAGGNDKAEGIWGDDEHIWVAEDGFSSDNAIYAYNRSDGSQDTGVDIGNGVLEADTPHNFDPHGLWSDGERMFVVDGEDKRVYAYDMSDQTYDPYGAIPLLSANADSQGLWYDGRTLYVVDDGDDKVYTYALPRAASQVVWFGEMTVGKASDGPDLGWSCETTFGFDGDSLSPTSFNISDGDGGLVTQTLFTLYLYDGGLYLQTNRILAASPALVLVVSGREFDLSQATTGGGSSCTAHTEFGWSAGGISWSKGEKVGVVLRVKADAADVEPTGTPGVRLFGTETDAATAAVSVGDALEADTSAIADGNGILPGAFTYQWQRGTADIVGATGRSYLVQSADVDSTLRVQVRFTDGDGNAEGPIASAATTTVAVPPAETLGASFDLDSSNSSPSGIWADSTTVWVANDANTPDNKIFAYDRATGARDTAKDIFTIDARGNDSPRGLWSDGTTMFVLDRVDRKIYAYKMAAGEFGVADSTKDITLAGGNDKAEGIWGDADTIWVADDDFGGANRVFAYQRSDGSRDMASEFENTVLERRPPHNFDPHGLTSDGSTLFVVDGEDRNVYAYGLSSGHYEPAGSLSLDPDNANAQGLAYDGGTLWVVDDGDDRVYAYSLTRSPGAWGILLTNAGQTPSGAGRVTSTQRLAQRFKTGPLGDYELLRVTLPVQQADSTDVPVVSLHASNASDRPGDKITGLAAPSPLRAGSGTDKATTWVFTAPAGTILSADTKYFIVATTTGDRYDIATTGSDDEDPRSLPDWFVGDAYHFAAAPTYTYHNNSGSNAFLMTLEGRRAAEARDGTANTAPVFANATVERSVAENTAAGVDVGAPITATDSPGETLTYSLGGADAGSFSIVEGSGQIRTSAALDFEAKSSYTVTVTASDGTDSATATVTITVTDVDEPPAAPAPPTVTATSGSTTSLDVSWTAPDNTGPPITGYDVRVRPSGEILWGSVPHSGTVTSATITGVSSDTLYEVRVRASNDEGTGDWSTPGSGRTAVPVNNAPVFADATVSRSVAENTAAGTDLGAPVAATDADDDTLTYSLGGTDAGSFTIVEASGQIRTSAALDFEAKSSYTVTVTASDGIATATATVTITVTDVDEAPAVPAPPTVTATSGSTTSLDVNWTAPDNAGKPPITDYDVQYRQGTTGSWSDRSHNGTATSATITGLAADTPYQVRVRARNDEGAGDWSTPGSGRTASPVSNAPVFANATVSRSVAENTAAGADVGAPVAATDADGDTLTYSLGGADVGSFTIVEESGQIRTSAALDFETKSSYTVTVTASDATDSATATVTITVTDVAEPPAAPAAPTVTATPGHTTSLNASWTAPDNTGPPITGYEVGIRPSGVGQLFWTNVPRSGTVPSMQIAALSPDTLYEVRVRARNDEGTGDWSTPGSGRTGAPVNNAPVFADATVSRSVAENTAAGTDLGAPVAATDADDDTLTYSLGGTDAGSFTIVEGSGQIRTSAALDFEAKSSYTVTVTASDGIATATATVTITVTDVDEAPAVPAPPTVTATSGSTTSLDVNWTAPDNTGPPITGYDVQYRKATSISLSGWGHSGTATSTTIYNLAADTPYQVRVRARNDEGAGDWSNLGSGRTAAPVNNAPVFAHATVTRSVAENTAAGTDLGTPVAATDADSDTLTYSLGGTDAGSFSIVEGSGQIRTSAALDFEAKSSYTVTVTASDGTATATATVTITVTDVDEPPAAPAAPTITTVTSTGLTVSWTAPDNAGKPPITGYDVRISPSGDSQWQAVAFGSAVTSTSLGPLSSDTLYEVQVRARNDEGTGDWSSSGSGRTAAPVNNAPVFANATVTRSVAENTAAGADVGTPVAATDADADTLTYSLGGADAGSFSIVEGSGQIRTSAALDFEAKSSYTVTVTASDGTATATATVRITVTDVDEPPAAPAAPTITTVTSTSLTVSWTAPDNAGKPPITDYDVQYRQGTTGSWSDRSHNGTATRATITGLAADTPYQVRVRARNDEGTSDWSSPGSGRTGTAANNAPEFAQTDYVIRVAENTPAGRDVGTPVAATDADSDTLTYSLGGADAGSFSIVAGSGQIRTSAALDFEAKSAHSLTVTASDGIASASALVLISVQDRDEPPDAPSAPTVSATSGSTTSLTVSWAAPPNAGKPRISDYDVQYRQGTTGSWSDRSHNGTATRATISGLAADTPYQVRVRARNAEGIGDWSSPGSGRTAADAPAHEPPGDPVVVESVNAVVVDEVTRTSARVSVFVPVGSLDVVVYLQYGTDDWGPTLQRTASGGRAVFSLSGLDAGSRYTVRASVDPDPLVSEDWLSAKFETRVGLTYGPDAIWAKPTGGGGYELRWAPTNAVQPGSPAGRSGYRIERIHYGAQPDVVFEIDDSDATSFTDPGPLVAGETYYYFIWAINRDGPSYESASVAVTPRTADGSAAPPSAPRNLRWDRNAPPGQVRLLWDPPADGTADSYIVALNRVGDDSPKGNWTPITLGATTATTFTDHLSRDDFPDDGYIYRAYYVYSVNAAGARSPRAWKLVPIYAPNCDGCVNAIQPPP